MNRLLGNLTRISSGPVILEIDGLRFFCIGAVVLFHVNLYVWTKIYHQSPLEYTGFVPRLLSQGGWGVELFFVISGFVVSLPFARHALLGTSRPSIKRYFLRRLTRLEPPYILNLLVIFVLLLSVSGDGTRHLLPHLLASATYTHGFIYAEPSTINPAAWSLEIEVQFYVLAPLFAQIFFVGSKAIRRALLLSVVALAVTFPYTLSGVVMPERLFDLNVLRYVAYFVVGMMLVDFYLLDWQEPARRSVAWDLAGVAAFAAAAAVCVTGLHPHVITPFLFFVIGCAAFRGTYTGRLLRLPLLTITGGMCYTIYLYHGVIISAVGRLLGPLRTLSVSAAVAVATLPLSLITLMACGILFAMVERPCMDPAWPSKLVARVRGVKP